MVTFDFPAEGLIAIRLSTGAVREIITNQSHYNPAAMFVPAPPSNLNNPVMDYFPSITYIKKFAVYHDGNNYFRFVSGGRQFIRCGGHYSSSSLESQCYHCGIDVQGASWTAYPSLIPENVRIVGGSIVGDLLVLAGGMQAGTSRQHQR